MTRHSLGALALSAALAGCNVGPNFHPPKFDPGANFSEVKAASATQPSRPTTRPIQVIQWWTLFHDPQLTELEQRALRSNLNLQQAESRIREARAARIVAGAPEYPVVNVGAGYQHARGSRNVVFPFSAFSGAAKQAPGKQQPTRLDQPTQVTGAAPAPGTSSSTGAPVSPLGSGGLPGVITDLYQAGFDASWELDIFGGTRRAVEAANDDYQAAVADQQDIVITLMAEVAANYIELRQYQRQIQIAQENLSAQQQTLALTENRFHGGVTTELDVARARAQVATTAAGIPLLDEQVHASAHRIAVLMGERPAALIEELTQSRPIPRTPDLVPVGMPADLIRRRPDIRRAEWQLAAATARVGQATAQLYPRFSILGSFGFDATKFARVADWQSHYYSIGPGVSWPIFDAGRIRANIRVQSESQAQALSAYEQTVLLALQDVEDALVSYSREQMRRAALAEAVSANRQAVDLATQQYQQGVTDFLTVLESQRSLYGAQDALAQSDAKIAADLVSLYKALGGGWESAPPASSR